MTLNYFGGFDIYYLPVCTWYMQMPQHIKKTIVGCPKLFFLVNNYELAIAFHLLSELKGKPSHPSKIQQQNERFRSLHKHQD